MYKTYLICEEAGDPSFIVDHASHMGLTCSLSVLHIPSLKPFFSLPREVLERIEVYAQNTHIYYRTMPRGPGDQGEYEYICQTCGHVY